MKNRKYNPQSDAVQLARQAERQHRLQHEQQEWQQQPLQPAAPVSSGPRSHKGARGRLWFGVLLLVLLVCLGAVVQFWLKQGRLPTLHPELQKPVVWDDAQNASSSDSQYLETTWDRIQEDCPRITPNDILRLVNQEHPLPQAYQPNLTAFEGSHFLLQPVVCEPLTQLYHKVLEETGEEILLQSTYRSYEDQVETYALMPDVAQKPGCSEHETGLAIDLAVFEHAGMLFIETAGGQATHRLAPEYGFILRYLEGCESITGVTYEPWHFRYIGLPHSILVSESGQTLEEYYQSLKPGVFYRSGNYLISRQNTQKLKIPSGWETGSISPDGMGGYLLTLQQG